MRRVPFGDNKTVELMKGEVIPVKCPCGCIYQPAEGSERSECPECHTVNLHGEQEWKPLPAN
jgi:hypothetical protein